MEITVPTRTPPTPTHAPPTERAHKGWTHHRARVAVLSRDLPADDPRLLEAKRDLKAARLEDHVAAVVESFPPLTDAQRARVATLLTRGGDGGVA